MTAHARGSDLFRALEFAAVQSSRIHHTLQVQLINEDCMYVVSINDCGEERNFLATMITFTGSQLNATINGMQRKFDVGQLIDIETVDMSSDVPSWTRIEPKQPRRADLFRRAMHEKRYKRKPMIVAIKATTAAAESADDKSKNSIGSSCQKCSFPC